MKVLRGLLPVRLVLVIELMPEGLAPAVHGHDKVFRGILAHQAHHRVEEAEDRGDIVPAFVLQRIAHECEIGTVDLTVPVYDEYSLDFVCACI